LLTNGQYHTRHTHVKLGHETRDDSKVEILAAHTEVANIP